MFQHRTVLSLVCLSAAAACTPPEESKEEFAEPLIELFAQFDGDTTVLAEQTLLLEASLVGVDLAEGSIADRSSTPPLLTEADVEGLEHPDFEIVPLERQVRLLRRSTVW